jgi:hypothetical protein
MLLAKLQYFIQAAQQTQPTERQTVKYAQPSLWGPTQCSGSKHGTFQEAGFDTT